MTDPFPLSSDLTSEELAGALQHGDGTHCHLAKWLVNAAAEVERLRTELTVARNRLGNAVGAIVDAGGYCTGPEDVTAAIGRLAAERDALRSELLAWENAAVRWERYRLVETALDRVTAERDALRTAGDRLADALREWLEWSAESRTAAGLGRDHAALDAWREVRGDQ